MKNPVLIFYMQNRTVGDWRYTGPKLPLAWTEGDAKIDPERDSDVCRVLMLNDGDKNLPILRHTNRNVESELLVVRHYNSDYHRAGDLPGQLQHLGKYQSVGSFSHDPDDPIFCRIRDLLTGRVSASSFAQHFEKSRDRKLLIDLAAICQIGILGSTKLDRDLLARTLYQFPQDFQKEFTNALGLKQNDWAAAIGVVVRHASAIGV